MFPVTIGRTFDTMETDPKKKKKKIHVVTSHLCSPALTKISEMNYWLFTERLHANQTHAGMETIRKP